MRHTATSRWVLALAVFAAVMGPSIGLNGVVLGVAWMPRAAFTVAVVLAAAAATRRFPRVAPLAPLAGFAALWAGLVLLFFADSSVLGVIPTVKTFEDMGALLEQSGQTILVRSAPIPLDDGIAFIICAGLGLAALLIDILALAAALPAAGGLGILLILFVPAIIKPESVGVPGFVAAGVGYLILLGCCHWYAPGGKPRPSGNVAPSGTRARAAWLTVVVVAATVAIPLAIPGFSTGAFPQGSRLGQPGNVAGIDPMVSLGNDLRNQGSGAQVFYDTDSATPVYLRTSTLEDFSGHTWKPDPRTKDRQGDPEDIRNAYGPVAGVPVVTTQTRIYTDYLISNWLPAPYAPSRILGLKGPWTWDPETLTVMGSTVTTMNQSYLVTSVRPELTPEILRATGSPRRGLDPVFTKLPGNLPSIITDTARSVTKGLDTAFDKALALQDYLRATDFTYSEKTPLQQGYDGAGMDVIAKFLQVKAGYCVHFSSAMAVMARVLGIPSRIAIGYAPGSLTGRTDDLNGHPLTGYMVNGHNAHAWPELYFEGVGWVPFEPTPTRGQVPAYAQVPVSSAPSANNNDLFNPSRQQPTAPATPAPGASAAPAAAAGATPAAERGAGWGMALVLAFVALAGPCVCRALVRRRRLALVRGAGGASRPDPAVIAWREVRDSAVDYGVRPDPARTPRAQAAMIGARLGPATDGADAVMALAHAFERAVYGRAPAPSTGASSSGAGTATLERTSAVDVDLLAEQLESVVAGLENSATAAARLRAVVLPQSLFSRS
ncbi:transglutaminase TgpA family protein [Specibacter cremeus]|uniref:transglutaminase TgpA family protein n=1 Tax=Specibacter cremeus TaxID=1629051 RepID=UPI000F769397|nr:DUF3488 and transglutaminase-like domain-containing protein [Specibacter cremeus]